MPKARRIEKAHCNQCGNNTKHYVIAERESKGADQATGSDIEIDYEWSVTSTMLECLGCESVTLRKASWNDLTGDTEVSYYPPSISRDLPVWIEKLPRAENELLRELYTALHADSPRLAIMGARALVDMLMTREVGDIGGFSSKITELKKKGIISEVNAEVMGAALEMGHAAAHRGHKPKNAEVSQVVDIVENLLHTSILKDEAKVLKASTPKRKP